MDINRFTGTGYLTRNAELRYTASGLAVLGFGLAINDHHKNKETGEWEDYPNYIECSLFGTYGESLIKRISKGSRVALSGKLHWSQWERDGQKRSKVEIYVEQLEPLSGKETS